MRSQLIRWSVLGVLTLPLFSAAADTPAKPNVRTMDDLARRLQELKAEVKLYPGGTEPFSKSLLDLNLQRWPTTRPESKTIVSTEPATLPPGAVPFQFNGMTYYIVPVGK